jgi:hypothetical protein
MEIKANNNIDSVARAMASQVKAAPPKAPADAAAFEHAQGLDQALLDSPAVRPEVVARAQQLISDVAYPPQEMIKRIAILMAANSNSPATDSAPPQA